jgi:hypothetical protein
MNVEKTMRSSRQFSWLATTLLGLLILNLTGCVSVPNGSTAMRQQALSFAPPSGKAGVYVIRPWGFLGFNFLCGLTFDYYEFGSLAPNTYLFAVVPPGKHIIRVPYDSGSYVIFIAEPGKNYFFTIKPEWGNLFRQISKADGQAYVRKYKLSGEEEVSTRGFYLPTTTIH